jgi:hypothetical protein
MLESSIVLYSVGERQTDMAYLPSRFSRFHQQGMIV